MNSTRSACGNEQTARYSQPWKRIFDRLQHFGRISQKIQVAALRKSKDISLPSCEKPVIEKYEERGLSWSGINSFVLDSLSKRNKTQRKLLRSHQRRALSEDSSLHSTRQEGDWGEAVFFTIASLFSFLSRQFRLELERGFRVKNMFAKTETVRIVPFGGVQNV
ncbi:MAG: hypothetical protein VX278_01445 [Myxococcota bacterium]|nr:hypothetical protein [Myxococcota bacterium]